MGLKKKMSGCGDAIKWYSAYTLAEVVIVMLVVAVIVGVSIKITKAKLDNIVSYTYYSGYSTLRSVTKQVLNDFKSTDSTYMDKEAMIMPKTLLSQIIPLQKAMAKDGIWDYYSCAEQVFDFSINISFKDDNVSKSSKFYTFRSYGSFSYLGGDAKGDALADCRKIQNGYTGLFKRNSHPYYDNFTFYDSELVRAGHTLVSYPPTEYEMSVCPGKIYRGEGDKTKNYFDYSSRHLDATYSVKLGKSTFLGTSLDDASLQALESCNHSCLDGVNNNCGALYIAPYPRRFSCVPSVSSYTDTDFFPESEKDVLDHWPVCETDRVYSSSSNTCTNQPTSAEIKTARCQEQKEWQGYPTCGWHKITCTEGNHWSVNSCACVQEQPTVPRKGINFCEKFVSYANTKSNSSECSGDAIPSDLTDFSDKTADITLRNGMRIYNIRQNPAPIPVLAKRIL